MSCSGCLVAWSESYIYIYIGLFLVYSDYGYTYFNFFNLSFETVLALFTFLPSEMELFMVVVSVVNSLTIAMDSSFLGV